MKTKLKISSGLLLFLFLIVLIFLTLPKADSDNAVVIKKIELQGNHYLSADEYLTFTNTQKEEALRGLKIIEIKDRFEKHPYVKYADVLPIGNGVLQVVLHEKNFQAILFFNDNQYLVDENLNVAPLLPLTNNIDLPVLENVKNLRLNRSRKSEELKKGMKILFAAKLLDETLLNAISEINLNNGGDIYITFSDDDYTLRLGRGNEVRKLAYFDALFENLKRTEQRGILQYVDLRFKDEICLGFKSQT